MSNSYLIIDQKFIFDSNYAIRQKFGCIFVFQEERHSWRKLSSIIKGTERTSLASIGLEKIRGFSGAGDQVGLQDSDNDFH